uniref:Uncharacterized protein n=1 Tax=Eucampia antarctica TaxID=49252 RepID=A0A7S2R074_9STRA|mmetsp:Transcript_11422/g.10933  ORF Transcript_11422/g.10933 Transcript_11422/m.10933 type:complete len:465 (+) Transcript_11422:122-1516(+)
MGQVLAIAATYCCCSATNSLFQKCLGSTTSSGRKRSVLLLYITITAALVNQYVVAPYILERKLLFKLPFLSTWIYNSWTSGCNHLVDNETVDLFGSCVGNAAVYRPTLLATVFFFISAAVSKANPQLNSEAWPEKFILFLLALALTTILPNAPLLFPVYLIAMRMFAGIFVIVQQVILIDLAYNWNDNWLDNANECDRLNGYGSGAKWLKAIIMVSLLFYIGSFVAIGFLYNDYSGCTENSVIITMTLINILVVTIIQLSGTEGSLMTSAVVSAYTAYLAFAAVSKNPNGECNPSLGSNNVWSIAAGLILTSISLAWTGWSWTAEQRLNTEGVQKARSVSPNHVNNQNPENLNLDVPFLDPDDQPTTGVVMESDEVETSTEKKSGSGIWKLNIILALISCWVAASLTGWGALQQASGIDGTHSAANPEVSKVNMWMITLSQWVALALYTWTLVAPRIFPDRDFS